MRGRWQPLVTTEEFEQGLAILARREKHRVVRRKHDYLLKGLIYIQLPDAESPVKLTVSTSNASRASGGTAYYCIPRSAVNLQCSLIDAQIPAALLGIQVDPDLLPSIRESYTEELARKLGHLRPSEREELEASLRAVDQEEARAARLFASGKITEQVWDMLWADWQDRRRTLQTNLKTLSQKHTFYVQNLDAALTIIEKVGILYRKLERSKQKDLLHQMVERVVVNPEGTLIRLELLPPFPYLRDVTRRVRDEAETEAIQGKQNTSTMAGACSDYVPLGGPEETRTPDLYSAIVALSQLSYRPL